MPSTSASATHYDTLGVPRNADQAAIRKAYLRASLRSHPDKNPGREEEAKAEFVDVGQAYSVLGDPEKRAAYDRDLSSGKFRFRPQRYSTTTNGQSAGKSASTQQQATSTQQQQHDDSFDKFADLFDETVAGMSEEELNMAMGLAATIGSVLGGIAGSRASKSRNSALATIGSAIGSAVASQAASTLVKTVHEDSKQRTLERRERDAAIARGESVPESKARGGREQIFKDAGKAFQNVSTAMGGSSGTKQRANNDTTTTSNGEGGKGQFSWKEAAKLVGTAVSACVEMQREANSSKDGKSR